MCAASIARVELLLRHVGEELVKVWRCHLHLQGGGRYLTYQLLHLLHGLLRVGSDGHRLVVDADALYLAEVLLRLVAQLAVDGEHRLLVLGQYALCKVLDVLVFLLLLLEFCHLLAYLTLTTGISSQSLFQQFVDFRLYFLLVVEVLVGRATLSTFATGATHDLADGHALCTVHGAVGLCLGAIHLPDLLVALLDESYEVLVAVVSLFVDAEGAPLGVLLVRVLFLVTNNVTLILLRGWIITFANRSVFVFKLLIVLVALYALRELCPTAGALLELLKAHAVGLCQLVVVGIDGLARLVDFVADEFHHLLHATLQLLFEGTNLSGSQLVTVLHLAAIEDGILAAVLRGYVATRLYHAADALVLGLLLADLRGLYGLHGAQLVEFVVGQSCRLDDAVDVAEVSADVAIVDGCQETFIQALRCCHRAAPLVDARLTGKECVLCHVESHLAGGDGCAPSRQRLYIDAQCACQSLQSALGVHLGLLGVAEFLVDVVELCLRLVYARLQLVKTGGEVLAEGVVLLLVGHVLVHHLQIDECLRQFINLAAC